MAPPTGLTHYSFGGDYGESNPLSLPCCPEAPSWTRQLGISGTLINLCFSSLAFAAVVSLWIPDSVATEMGANADTLRWHADVLFACTSAFAAIAAGIVTDTSAVVERTKILMWTVMLSTATCVLSALAQASWQLIILRGIAGACTGAGVPIIFVVTSDLANSSKRSCLFGLMLGACGCGAVLGRIAAAAAANALGWRTAFTLVGLQGLLAPLSTHFFSYIPERGAAEPAVEERWHEGHEEVHYREKPIQYVATGCRDAYAQLLFTPTLALIFVQSVLSALPLTGLPAGLVMAQDGQRVSSESAAITFQQIFALGGALGVVAGGAVTQAFDSTRSALTLVAVATACATVPALSYLEHPSDQLSVIAPAALLTGALAFAAMPVLCTTVANCSTPETRGAAFGLFWMTVVTGLLSGPILVDLFRFSLGERVGIRMAVASWMTVGILQYSIRSTVESDESMTQDLVRMQICSGPDSPGGQAVTCGDT